MEKDNKKNTFNKIRKALTYVSKLFSSAVLVLLLVVGAFLIYYLFSAKKYANDPDYIPKMSLYTIVSGSMEPAIKTMDVVLDIKVDKPEDIKIGDVITFRSTSSISEDLIVTHRVIGITQNENGEYEYTTKGDWNPTSDPDTAKFSNVIGKVAMRFPQLGQVQFFLASKMGWFLVVLLPAMCVIIYDILKLFKLIMAKKSSDKIIPTNPQTPTDNVNNAIEKIKKNDYINKINELKENNTQNSEEESNVYLEPTDSEIKFDEDTIKELTQHYTNNQLLSPDENPNK